MSDNSEEVEIKIEPEVEGTTGRTGAHTHKGVLGKRGLAGLKGRAGPRGERGKPGRLIGRTNPGHLGKVYLWGMYRGTWALLAYLLLALTVAFGFYQQSQAADAAHQASIDADYRTCASGNLLREQIRNLILVASAGGGVDYTKVKGYDKLDQSFKEFLNELNARSRDGGNAEFRERSLAAVQDRDCDKLYPERSEKAKLLNPNVPQQP